MCEKPSVPCAEPLPQVSWQPRGAWWGSDSPQLLWPQAKASQGDRVPSLAENCGYVPSPTHTDTNTPDTGKQLYSQPGEPVSNQGTAEDFTLPWHTGVIFRVSDQVHSCIRRLAAGVLWTKCLCLPRIPVETLTPDVMVLGGGVSGG